MKKEERIQLIERKMRIKNITSIESMESVIAAVLLIRKTNAQIWMKQKKYIQKQPQQQQKSE